MFKPKNFHPFVKMAVLLVFSGCLEQKAPEVSVHDPSGQESLQRAECVHLRLSQNVLSQDNVLAFFKCTGDNQKFPALYHAIEETGPEAWNHLMAPINELYLNNRQEKQRILGEFRHLDESGGLDDLARILKKFTEKNLWDAFYDMLPVPGDSTRPSLLSEKEIKDFLKNVTLEPKELTSVVNSVNGVMEAAKSPVEDFAFLMRRLGPLEEFQTLRLEIIKEVFNELSPEKIDDKHKRIFKNVFSDEQKRPSNLYSIFQSEEFDTFYIQDLLAFPIITYPGEKYNFSGPGRQLSHDLTQLYQYAIGNSSCQCGEEGLVALKMDQKIKELFIALGKRDRDGLAKLLTELNLMEKMADATCGLFEKLWQEQNWDLENTYNKTQIFLENGISFELLGFLQSLALDEGDELFWLSKGPAQGVEKSLNLLQLVLDQGEEYSLGLAKGLKEFLTGLPVWVYPSIGESINYFLSQEHLQELEILGKFFLALPESYQIQVLKIFDEHFVSGSDTWALLNFYQGLFQDLPRVAPEVKKYYSRDDHTLDKTYRALFKMADAHRGEKVLLELRQWFSREKILQVIHFLSGQVPLASGFSAEKLQEEYLAQFYSQVVSSELILGGSSSQLEKDFNLCQRQMIERGFFDLVKKWPKGCQKLEGKSAVLTLLGALFDIHSSYQLAYPQLSLFQENEGVLSQENLFSGLVSLKTHEIKLSWEMPYSHTRKGGISGLFYYVRELLSQDVKIRANFLKVFENSLRLFGGVFTSDVESGKRIINRILENLVAIKDEEFQKIAKMVGSLIQKLQEINSPKPSDLLKEYSCKEFLKQDIGPYPRCPGNERISQYIFEAINVVTRKFEGSPRLGQQMLKAMDPKGGFTIPFESSSPRPIKVDLEDILLWAYDLGTVSESVEFIDRRNNEKKIIEMTYSDQIDAVIREISFMDNIYGSMWVNEVARSEDYNKTVEKQEKQIKLLKTSGGIMRILPKKEDENGQEHWLPMESKERLFNSLSTYGGLKANNYLFDDHRVGSPPNSKRQHGDFIVALMTMLTSSSAIESQKIKTFKMPHNPELGENHNGQFLVKLVELYGNAQTHRWIRSRLGPSDQEFHLFLNSPKFKRVNQVLLGKISFKKIQENFQRFSQDFQGPENLRFKKLIPQIVEDLAGMDEKKLSELEKIVGELLVTSSFVGPDELYPAYAIKYKHLNIAQLSDFLLYILDFYPQFKRVLPLFGDLTASDMAEIRQGITLFNEELFKGGKEGSLAYENLNLLFDKATHILFKDGQGDKGIYDLLVLLKNYSGLNHNLSEIKNGISHLNALVERPVLTNFSSQVAKNLLVIGNENWEGADLLPLRSYFTQVLNPMSSQHEELWRLTQLLNDKVSEITQWFSEKFLPMLDLMGKFIEELLAMVELSSHPDQKIIYAPESRPILPLPPLELGHAHQKL